MIRLLWIGIILWKQHHGMVIDDNVLRRATAGRGGEVSEIQVIFGLAGAVVLAGADGEGA
jgi:hypothetical protein